MTEASPETKIDTPMAAPETYRALLASLTGKVVTMVNPESLEEAPTGYQLTKGFYRAKVLDVGRDYVAVIVEFVHRRGDKSKETVKQYLPIGKIKRLTVSKSEVFLHI